MIARPAEVRPFGFPGLRGDGRLAGVSGQCPVAGVALAAIPDLGEHARGAKPRVLGDEQRPEGATVGVLVELVADLDRQLRDPRHDRFQGGDEREHELPASLGLELGYHYWLRWARSLRGVFLGPSLLLGSTTNASVGPTADAQTYWGLAFDAGAQHVFPGGFTLGAGLGLGFVHMADASAFFPRILLQMGWSF